MPRLAGSIGVVGEHRRGQGAERPVEKRLATDQSQAIVSLQGLEPCERRVDRQFAIEHGHRDPDREIVADRIEHVDHVVGVFHRTDVGQTEGREMTGRRDRRASPGLDRGRRDDRVHELQAAASSSSPVGLPDPSRTMVPPAGHWRSPSIRRTTSFTSTAWWSCL